MRSTPITNPGRVQPKTARHVEEQLLAPHIQLDIAGVLDPAAVSLTLAPEDVEVVVGAADVVAAVVGEVVGPVVPVPVVAPVVVVPLVRVPLVDVAVVGLVVDGGAT